MNTVAGALGGGGSNGSAGINTAQVERNTKIYQQGTLVTNSLHLAAGAV